MINYTWQRCCEPQYIPGESAPCPYCTSNSYTYHAKYNDTVYIESSGSGNASTTTVHIKNVFHSDISPKQRDVLKTLFKDVGDSKFLVLNISQLKIIDSWGMDIIINLVDDVIANNGYVHIIYGNYTSYLSSLKRDLARHGMSVGFQEEFNPFNPHGKRHET